MGPRSQHISVRIELPASEVYEFVADPVNLPEWAAGLAGAQIEYDGEHWFTESPMGRVRFWFVPENELGVLDHHVTLPSGETVYNPLRVIQDGDGSEVVFTLRQRIGMSDEAFQSDAATVARDLATLKARLEGREAECDH